MNSSDFFIGEDTVTASANGADIAHFSARLLSSGAWEEVVPGMADITVKFDPDSMSADNAKQKFEEQLAACEYGVDLEQPPSPILLAASSDGKFAPDAAMVCSALGIAVDELPLWLSARRYRVSMMGFQPGFAYLEDVGGDDFPVISRLETPRQLVAAGSIGMLGGKACIYSLDGPGGWPIIGKVSETLFDPENTKAPALLSPGQLVQFSCGN